MADVLDVSGGTTSVATEDLEVAVDQLTRLSAELRVVGNRLAALEAPGQGFHAEQARVDIEIAVRSLGELSDSAARLSLLVTTAARGYEFQERVVASLTRSLTSGAAHVAGTLAPGLVISAGVVASIAGGVWSGLRSAGAFGTPPSSNGIPKASPFLRENNWLLTNTALPSQIRRLTGSIGPFMMGSMGGPPVHSPGTFELGARGVVTAGRAFGAFAETPVRLVGTIPQPVTSAPQGYADRLERVPHSEDPTAPQVLIERYTVPGEPDRFSVYVGGTVEFMPHLTSQPWDLTSNVMNAAGETSGSVASVRAAMELAGIDAQSPVQLTGYSQGGGVVASIAASGEYNLQGVAAFGGPTGEIPISPDVPAILVEHTDDIVPALGGEQANEQAILVRRNVFEGEEIPDDYAVPAHHIEYYLATARLMDESRSPQLDAAAATLDGFTKGATLATSTAYRYERDV